jgi:hypothetical protein
MFGALSLSRNVVRFVQTCVVVFYEVSYMNSCYPSIAQLGAIKIVVRAFMLFTATMLSACNAQSPSGSSATSTPPTAAAPLFREPAITGKIVDKHTLQPIAGVFVYGYYITFGGGTRAGGSRIGEGVKSFLTQTDASGVWRLDAWDTGTREIGGVMGTKFPVLTFYKPDYDLWSDQLIGIKQYRPKSDDPDKKVTVRSDGTLDWTQFEHRMVAATTAGDRAIALRESQILKMMAMGDCGWESLAPLLLAQHNELKGILRREIPAEFLDADGYQTTVQGHPTGFSHPHPGLRGGGETRTTVDNLRTAARVAGAAWGCAQPDVIFGDRK